MIHWTEEALKAHKERIGAGVGRIVRGRDNVGDSEPGKAPKPPKSRSMGEEALETALRAARAPAWLVEYRFDSQRRWRADFAWPEACLLVEVEGGSWVSGRHNRGKGFEADCEKYAEAVIQGWRVLRFTTEMVEDGRALGLIMRALNG